MRYLSDAWIEATAAALTAATPLESPLTVGYIVSGGPDGERSYSMVYGPSAATCLTGVVGANVVFVTDWDTAVSIAAGKVSAQRAFLDGHLRLDGDAVALLDSQVAIAAFEPHLAGVRASTTYS